MEHTFSIAVAYVSNALPNLSSVPIWIAPCLAARDMAWGKVLGGAGCSFAG